jgi:hypothetical protein
MSQADRLRSTIVHTAMNPHAPSEMMNVTTLTRINQFHGLPPCKAMTTSDAHAHPAQLPWRMYELET